MNKKQTSIKKNVWIFFLITLIFTLVILGWKYFRDTSVNQKKYDEAYAKWHQSQMSVEEIKAGMTQAAITEAYDRVYCWKLMKEGTYYLENSLLMRIDPYEKWVGKIHLSEGTFEINEKFITQVKNELGWDIEEQFLEEVIALETNASGCVVMVCADTKENCDALLMACITVIEKMNSTIDIETNIDSEVDLKLLDQYNRIAEANRAYDEQAIYYELNTADGAMELFEAVLREEYPEFSVTENGIVEEPVLLKTTIEIKHVATAIVSGVLCAIALFLFYFMHQSIQTEESDHKI